MRINTTKKMVQRELKRANQLSVWTLPFSLSLSHSFFFFGDRVRILFEHQGLWCSHYRASINLIFEISIVNKLSIRRRSRRVRSKKEREKKDIATIEYTAANVYSTNSLFIYSL